MTLPGMLLGERTAARGSAKAILATSVILFAAWSWLAHGGLAEPTFDVDSFDYAQMSRQLYRGEGFTMQQTFPYVLHFLDEHGISITAPWPNTTRFPLIALQQAAAFAVVGVNDRGLLVACGAMFAATAVLMFLLGNRLFGPLAGVIAAVAVAVDPAQLYYSRSGLLETGAGFFTVLVALTLVAATEDSRHRRRAAMALGAALGLAFLQRYDLLALTPIAILLLLARSTTAARTPLAMWCTAGLTATAGLWIARNLVVVGTVLGSTSVDRNLLGGVVAGDVYMATRTVSAWSYVLENLPAFLVKFDVARIWFVQHAATLFGGLLAMASAAVALALPVLERSRAARTAWMFLVGGFVARALLLSIMHNEPRFYLSFTPLLLVLGTGGAVALLRMLPAVFRPLVPALATLVVVIAALSVPRAAPASISGSPPAELVTLSGSLPDAALVASDVSWLVAWYCDRPSVRFSGVWPELVEIERLGARIDAVLLTRPASRRFAEGHVAAGGGLFTQVPATPPGYFLWLRRPGSTNLAVPAPADAR